MVVRSQDGHHDVALQDLAAAAAAAAGVCRLTVRVAVVLAAHVIMGVLRRRRGAGRVALGLSYETVKVTAL